MKIVCISDTHCQLDRVVIPDGDVLIHSGDLTYKGDIREISKELFELSKYRSRFKKIVLISGNHDWLSEKNPQMMSQICEDNGIKYLCNSDALVEGLKFWGSPVTPFFFNWAWNVNRGDEIKKYWDLIPSDTQVLITHGPPGGTLDLVPSPKGFHAGCDDLYNRIQELKDLKLHVFGHLHMNHGTLKIGHTTFVNASICTEQYTPDNQPIVIDI